MKPRTEREEVILLSSRTQVSPQATALAISVIFYPKSLHTISSLMLRNLGNGGTLTLNNVQGNGASGGQWVAVYAANGDSSYRNMTITFVMQIAIYQFFSLTFLFLLLLLNSVNGGSSVVIQQPDTGSSSNPISVPVKLNLRSGANTLLFASGQQSA